MSDQQKKPRKTLKEVFGKAVNSVRGAVEGAMDVAGEVLFPRPAPVPVPVRKR